MEPPTPLFEVLTPLGFLVRTTDQYWNVLQHKHPEITGRLSQVQSCLVAPEQARHSKQDRAVYLSLGPYHLCVVARRLDGDGFVITCYLTDAIKEGAKVWPTSE